MSIIKLETRLPYNPKLKERTKELRKNMTEPEKKIWYWFLRGLQSNPPQWEGQRGSLRILKQRPIDNFIVDFYIPKIKLVIEIDWESHFDENWIAYDIERTQVLEWLWLKVIRFTNEEVMKNYDWVCETLEKIVFWGKY